MFKLRKIVGGRMNVPEPEEHIAGAAITPGMALTLSAGKLSLCTGANTPTHISLGSAASGEKVACFAVAHDMVFEVACSAAPTSLADGSKVTIATDALRITATTTDGVATVVSKNEAAAAGDKLYVKF